MSIDGVVLYGLVKLLAYCAWCWLALKLLASRASVGRAIRLGVARWALGIAFGVLIFFMVRPARSDLLGQYFITYIPVRVLEWGLIGLWALPPGHHWPTRRLLGWVGGGVLLSFATDWTSPQMIEHGRFCVGRCLC